MSDFAIELKGIDKWFGQVHANQFIDLAVPKGSIFGLVGENGAGKSTLVSILYGFYQADAGHILINGQEKNITSPAQAIKAGIGMVFQHLKLVPNMTVLDNLMLGREGGLVLAAGRRRARKLLLNLAQDYNLDVNPDALVQDLPLGLQQRVEILKQLYRGADILVLDEPTDVLTPQETDEFFQILCDLKRRSVTSVLITHKLKEILAVTSEVAVMRRGKIVGHLVTAETNEQELANLMVGRCVSFEMIKEDAVLGDPLLRVVNVSKEGRGRKTLDNVSFQVHGGEIVGIAGISGNGQTELLEVLAGINSFDSGSIFIGDKELSPMGQCAGEVRGRGVAHVPEDRQKFGMIASFSATEVSVLGYQNQPPFGYSGLISWSGAKAITADHMDAFDVRPRNPMLLSGSFSGGNQQKLVLSRELTKGANLLLIGQPTRGVDVGAIEFIHEKLLEQRAAKAGILLVSGELEELIKLADRILVMFEGRVVGTLAAKEATEIELGLLMAGTQTEMKSVVP